MDDEDEELHRPGTSGRTVEPSDRKPDERAKETTGLNNNVLNGYGASECCTDCDTTAQHDHMIAASLVYCDQEDVDDSNDDDNCCIYTYRGDRQEPIVEIIPVDDRSTSPLMDYLEMDFDPEPNVGVDSEGEDIIANETAHRYNDVLINTEESLPVFSDASVNKQINQSNIKKNEINGIDKSVESPVSNLNLPSTQCNGLTSSKEERNGCVRRTADTMVKKDVCQKLKRMRVDDLTCVKEMVWSEKVASDLQVNQVGVSACGATSVINALLALRIPFDIERLINTVGTRLRDDTASLIPYLESRAAAGCMPQDLVRTLETVTDSLVSARFFATRQNLDIPIAPWLASWIKKGAIPILTLNLQQATTTSSLIPDSWHHQMMYGIEYYPLRPECAQIYLTNPLSQSSLEVLRPQLVSPSSLMIRRNDVLSRWTPHTDLMPLATHPNRHWHRFNVLGQVVNVVREEHEDVQHTNHIVIPANYKSGITLAISTSSVYSHELKSVPEL